jgi:hypothetical protein
VFSLGPRRDYISSPVVKRERKWSESSAVKEEELGSRLIVISCD